MAQKANTSRIITIPEVNDMRGSLSFIESDHHIPFTIKRVFYIYNVPEGVIRGRHAHKKCHQGILCVSGSFVLNVESKLYFMRDQNEMVYVPPGNNVTLYDFTRDAVCLVIASEHFDEDDYARLQNNDVES